MRQTNRESSSERETDERDKKSGREREWFIRKETDKVVERDRDRQIEKVL